MDIDLYQELTGIEIDPDDEVSIARQITRTRLTLETLLGYTLKKKSAGVNQYEEKGKAKVDCIFRGTLTDIDDLELDPPDDVEGSYRLFPYHKADQLFKVDPFTRLYTVKLVFIRSGEEPNGITHKTFTASQARVQQLGGFAKYIERCNECFCTCECDECVQLAVEADWLNEDCLPEDLQYLWLDMIDYYTDTKKDIVAETLGTHSYKRSEKAAPETLDSNLAILKKYAGPNGSLHQTIVI